MKKLLLLIFVLFTTSCSTNKLGPDPFEGVVEVRDVSKEISESAEGDCKVENIIKQQLNLRLFQIAQQVCGEKTEEPVLFHLSEMVNCVWLALKHHELDPTPCEEEKSDD